MLLVGADVVEVTLVPGEANTPSTGSLTPVVPLMLILSGISTIDELLRLPLSIADFDCSSLSDMLLSERLIHSKMFILEELLLSSVCFMDVKA